MTDKEIQEKIAQARIIKGPWPEETHTKTHKRMFDNLVELLSDFENAMDEKVNPDSAIPKTEQGSVDWSNISIAYLIQWSLQNARVISHKHGEIDEIPV